MAEGKDLEGSAQGSKPQALTLRATCQGDASPWIPVFWGWGRALAPVPLPRWYFPQGLRRREFRAGCVTLILSAAQEVSRTQGGAFFFTKKAYCGSQTLCVAGSQKSVQTQPHPFSALKKPLKIMGIQGESLPDAPLAAHLRIRRSRIPRCVVKRRTAETRDSVSRPCRSPAASRAAGADVSCMVS